MSAIANITAAGATPNIASLQTSPLTEASPAAINQTSFSDMISQGLAGIEAKIDTANAQVRDFAIDDTVPIHQVTIALEEARLAVELAMQVRTRLVEGYREIMNMQL